MPPISHFRQIKYILQIYITKKKGVIRVIEHKYIFFTINYLNYFSVFSVTSDPVFL